MKQWKLPTPVLLRSGTGIPPPGGKARKTRKTRKGLPMDPVWRAKVSTPFMANGGGRQESPIDQKWDGDGRKGSRQKMLIETFNWSINLGDGPATPKN